ncbi:MAG TPA: SUMF1/EgtB/PvdO family nonheme iron enzyme [Panacibacter sp.]|nr:SUMF1/EgtB/PvdO family nonheme iron enzyme [Panacibacter sp.]
MREGIFLSYSHRDSRWLEKMNDFFKVLNRLYKIEIWDDTKIKAGANWRDEINEKLACAKVAILLVSQKFLASEFIENEELSKIFEKASSEGLKIIWISISACLYKETMLVKYQAANDPSKPLDSLPTSKQNQVLTKIGEIIKDAIKEIEMHVPSSNKNIQEELIENKVNTTFSITSKKANDIFLPEMIYIRGGAFMMGSTVVDIEEPIHEVIVDDFYIGKLPITFSIYDIYCESINIQKPNDEGWGRGNRPVINITWMQAIAFCNWLSDQHGFEHVYKIENSNDTEILDTNGYRLPSEAEWEYAARGGRQDKKYLYSGGNNIDQVAWYAANSLQRTHPVGEKNGNELGIHDMSGNIWEWCSDINHNNFIDAPSNGKPWLNSGEDNRRVVKGGYWGSFPIDCRSTTRCDWREDDYDWDIGFRLARITRKL